MIIMAHGLLYIQANKTGGHKMYKTDKEATDLRRAMHEDHYTLAYRLDNRKLTAMAGVSFEGRTCKKSSRTGFCPLWFL